MTDVERFLGVDWWTGWRELQHGDRVVSVHHTDGRVLSRGTVVRVSESAARGRRGQNVRRGTSAGLNYVLVDWDNGVRGRVSQPAVMLRRESSVTS